MQSRVASSPSWGVRGHGGGSSVAGGRTFDPGHVSCRCDDVVISQINGYGSVLKHLLLHLTARCDFYFTFFPLFSEMSLRAKREKKNNPLNIFIYFIFSVFKKSLFIQSVWVSSLFVFCDLFFCSTLEQSPLASRSRALSRVAKPKSLVMWGVCVFGGWLNWPPAHASRYHLLCHVTLQ